MTFFWVLSRRFRSRKGRRQAAREHRRAVALTGGRVPRGFPRPPSALPRVPSAALSPTGPGAARCPHACSAVTVSETAHRAADFKLRVYV